MKISFYSNYLTHHQLPFCLEMGKRLGENFTFIATEQIEEERIKLGYEDLNNKYSFVLNAYEGDEKEQKALALAKESDIVIFGSAPERYLMKRMKENKLSFRYTERPLKKGRWKLFNPHVLNTMLHLHTRYACKKLYLLCASAYTAKDCALVGGYWNKAYKWGYFPQICEYPKEEFLRLKKNNANLTFYGPVD